jgi:hypothetical protein
LSASNASRVVTSSESQMQEGQVNGRVQESEKSYTRIGQQKGELMEKNLENSNSVTRGRLNVANNCLSGIQNADEHGGRDLTVDGTNK